MRFALSSLSAATSVATSATDPITTPVTAPIVRSAPTSFASLNADSAAGVGRGLRPAPRAPRRTPRDARTMTLCGRGWRTLAATALALGSMMPIVGCASPNTATPPNAVSTRGAVSAWTSDNAGFDTHSWWYDTGREVVVFDAQFTPELARKVVLAIRAETRSPIRWVIVTHPNPDKFNGASVFQAEGAKVVASRATAAAIPDVHAYKKGYFVSVARMFADETYPPRPAIDVTFDGRYELAGGAVVLEELSHSGVSTTQTIAKIPALKAVVVGDLVHPRTHAWLEGGIRDGAPRPDVDAWLAALDELRAMAPDGWTVLPGRGPEAPVETAVREQQAYLRRVRDIVRDYVAALPDRSVLQGAQGAAHWKALAKRGEEAFPHYAHPYLLEYGVYGLALSFTDRAERGTPSEAHRRTP